MVKEFIRQVRSHYQRPRGKIHLIETAMYGNEGQYINSCLKSGKVSTVGETVEDFEAVVIQRVGAQYGLATNSGTAALHLSLIVCGVKPGDLVITQPFTFIATTNAILHAGARPIFIDIDTETLGLSPQSLTEFLTEESRIDDNGNCLHLKSGSRIAACIPVHTFGHPTHISEIVAICGKFGVRVIEDAAEGLGSSLQGKSVGMFGDVGVVSFNGNKIVTSGGGGMLITNDNSLFTQAKAISNQSKSQMNMSCNQIGYNYRMPALNASLGLAQWQYLDQNIRQKRELTSWYQSMFNHQDIKIMTEPEGAFSNYWMQAGIFPNREMRDDFVERTNAEDIETRKAWPLLNNHPLFEGPYHAALPNAIWAESRITNFPSTVIPHA